jgi:hypothetical protein
MTQRTPSRALHVAPIVVRVPEICNGQETGVFGVLTMHVGKMGVISETTLGESARNFGAKIVLNRSWGARLRVPLPYKSIARENSE